MLSFIQKSARALKRYIASQSLPIYPKYLRKATDVRLEREMQQGL